MQDAAPQLANAAKLGQAQVLAAALSGVVPAPATTLAAAAATLTVTTPTNVVLLENMVSCGTIRDESERKEVGQGAERGLGAVGLQFGGFNVPMVSTTAQLESRRTRSGWCPAPAW